MSLYNAGKKGAFKVTSLPSIGMLENIGLRSGTNVVIQNRYALGGPVLLRVEDAFSVALGKDIAVQIGVEQVG